MELGGGQFIPGFEDQIVGHKAGDRFDVKVTFPEEYNAKDLAGKNAVFATTVHEVKAKELPELDDEFAKDADDEVQTLDELKAKYRKQLEEIKTKNVESKFEEEAIKKVVENAKIVELPEEMIHEEVHRMVDQFLAQIKQQGISPEKYYQITGTTKEDLHQQYEKEAGDRIRTNLVIEAIAVAESIEATDESVQEEIKNLSEQHNLPIDQVEKFLSREMIEHDVKMKKALKLITDSAIEE